MKRRRILFLLVFIVIITILRETGVVNVNFYNSRINMTNSSNWTNNNLRSSDSNFCKPSPGDCIPRDISQITIVAYTPNGMYKSGTTTCEELHFHVYNKNHGLFWVPLYKNFTFSASAICNDGISMFNTDTSQSKCTHHQFSGMVTIRGQVTIKGFCSYREVKRLINDELVRLTQNIGTIQLKEL